MFVAVPVNELGQPTANVPTKDDAGYEDVNLCDADGTDWENWATAEELSWNLVTALSNYDCFDGIDTTSVEVGEAVAWLLHGCCMTPALDQFPPSTLPLPLFNPANPWANPWVATQTRSTLPVHLSTT
eukprot:363988-Chlamydomonas_euryale.AAC.5